jgi:hypothetical protein
MIGKKLSPVLEEMETTLWEYEAFNGAKPNYTLEGFRASTKIFMSALVDKFFEKQQAEGVSQEDTSESTRMITDIPPNLGLMQTQSKPTYQKTNFPLSSSVLLRPTQSKKPPFRLLIYMQEGGNIRVDFLRKLHLLP